jgi:hypothetical protein
MGQSPSEPAIQVEIDLFSGRANPVWELAPAEFSELVSRLQSLPAAPPAAHPNALLGYRGLRIGPLPAGQVDHGAASANPIIAVEVGGGLISATGRDGSVLHRIDTDQSVECWLLTVARGRVDESSRQIALANLDSHCP